MNIRQVRADRITHAVFVLCIAVGVQQANGDRGHLLVFACLHNFVDCR